MVNEEMMLASERFTVSVIVPTIGRPESLRNLLDSLAAQTQLPQEVVVSDGSGRNETSSIVSDATWGSRGLLIRYLRIEKPNAVRQRQAAIAIAAGNMFLFLDDDVVLEPQCIANLSETMSSDDSVVAVVADFSNEKWSEPTTVWRAYLRLVHGLSADEVQGKVVGPLLRYGYFSETKEVAPMQWIGTCNSLVRRSAYDACGGFSNFFLRRCTMNEDVDLGIKLSRFGRIYFCPGARLSHHHAPSGRVTPSEASEDDVINRYWVLRETLEKGAVMSFWLVCVFVLLETASNTVGALLRLDFRLHGARTLGRVRGLLRAAHGRRQSLE
jgi:GT2 family glycosyltransferase